MTICWASCLGDCSDKTSREHIFTESLFLANEVTVQGFSWCKDTPKTVGLGSVVSKILCRKHNNELSDVDEAAAGAFKALRDATRLSNSRSKVQSTYWHRRRFDIDGRGLERWFLKTLINIAFRGELAIGDASAAPGTVGKAFVEIAFGLRGFQSNSGLYFVGGVGDELLLKEIVRCQPLVWPSDRYIKGGLFTFRGYRFLLYLGTEEIRDCRQPLRFQGEVLDQANLSYRMTDIRSEIEGHLSHVIHFKW